MANVLIYGEIKAGKIKKSAFELASEGRKLADSLGGNVEAALLGPNAEQFAADLAKYGVDTVYVVESSDLESYNSEYYAQALTQIINEKKPEVVLLGHSYAGKRLGSETWSKIGSCCHCRLCGIRSGRWQIDWYPPHVCGKMFGTMAGSRISANCISETEHPRSHGKCQARNNRENIIYC